MRARSVVGLAALAGIGGIAAYSQVRNGNAQKLISKFKHSKIMMKNDLENMI